MAQRSPAPFTGVGVSLLTLFRGDGEVDAPATAGLASQLVQLGVKAVVVADAAGEGPALSAQERIEVLDAVRDAIPASSGVPVIAATGGAAARVAVRYTKSAVEHGADAVLVHSPPFARDPELYYKELDAAAAGRPVIAQHDPTLSWPGIELANLAHLRVSACDDCSGDASRLLETFEVFDGSVYTGSAALLALAGPAGAVGAIVALANAQPEQCAAAFAGDGAAQRALTKAHIALQIDFPEAIKVLTARRFGTSTAMRMG